MRCIVCDATEVEEFLDLGETALANKFLGVDELDDVEPAYPLRVGFCQRCHHVQLTEPVPPSAMFEDYLYVSSASDTLKAHLYELSDVVVARRHLDGRDLVVDIGCNDGTLLQGFARHGVQTLGVDPARNLAELAKGSGIDRYVGFFDTSSSSEIVERWGQASVITATNTFPHIPDVHGFMQAIDTALAPGGAFVIEAHYLVDMLEQVAFDTIYHEHVSYWALGPMQELFARHGMSAVRAERLPIHHGQLRVTVQRLGEGEPDGSVDAILVAERELGVDRMETYGRFADHAHRIKRELNETIASLRSAGHRVAGYGAPAKASTLLCFLDLGPDEVEYIADRSPLKQGRYTPSSHIPIVSPEKLVADRPEYVLLLAWNFVDEILEQLDGYRNRGGRFIIPVPEVRVV
jgi:SAM-dependent methyltransferase